MRSAMIVASLAAAQPAAAPQSFRIADVEFTMPTPAGFCPPQGKAAAAIQLASASDDDNVTHLALVRCGDSDASNPDYYMLKTPKATLAGHFDRAPFLAELTKAFALPEFNTDKGVVDNTKIEKRFGELIGTTPDVNGAIKPLGHDDVCGYMGGVLSFKSPAISYSRAVSLCLTVVGGKIIGITRYSDGTVPSNVVKHFATVRAMALSIKAKP